jgi:CheY-like chemotaxis protein
MAKKILIIEDEIFLAEMYKIKFEKEGFNVLIGNDGRKGIDLAQKEMPDLIFVDLVMPDVDGYEVLRTLKGDENTKHIKIFILSNLAQNGEIDKGMEAGADGYLLKASLTPTQLLETTNKILNGESIDGKNNPKNKQKKKKLLRKKKKNGTGKKVLLIEDEEDIIAMYEIQLEKEGFQVQVAKNGAWGLKLATKEKFDIIIMDMVMPAMNGYTAIKKIRKIEEEKNTPIIILSNSAQDRDIEKAKKCGATCYYLKSQITPKKLVTKINKLLK